jgi:hypothetical protein
LVTLNVNVSTQRRIRRTDTKFVAIRAAAAAANDVGAEDSEVYQYFDYPCHSTSVLTRPIGNPLFESGVSGDTEIRLSEPKEKKTTNVRQEFTTTEAIDDDAVFANEDGEEEESCR